MKGCESTRLWCFCVLTCMQCHLYMNILYTHWSVYQCVYSGFIYVCVCVCVCASSMFVYAWTCAFLHVYVLGVKQAGATEAGIIKAAVIKAVLIVLIGVINVLRVRLLTHTDLHRHLVQTYTPTTALLLLLDTSNPCNISCFLALVLHTYTLWLVVITPKITWTCICSIRSLSDDTDRKALYTNAYHTLALQWQCVSKPTSSPLAIIFLCVSASVSTVPFTPNNWKKTKHQQASQPRRWQINHLQTDVMPTSSSDTLHVASVHYVWLRVISKLRQEELGHVSKKCFVQSMIHIS